MRCVRGVSFKIQLSGRTITELKLERGLRQGDPLSPYLFIIASEVLSLMISHHEQHGHLTGIQLARGSPRLTHCMFADDTIVFLRATLSNCVVFEKILQDYCQASGQMINLDKSNLFFSINTPEDIRTDVALRLGIREVGNPGNYLGLPVLWDSSKQQALAFVKDIVGQKVMGWKRKSLSFAGREVMIKAVINAIPTYSMSCFKFPVGTCKTLDSLVSSFFWGVI